MGDETPSCRVAAVIPAAGCGERMGNPVPKQYLQVCGRPLILHCLRALEEVPWLEKIVLVADDLTKMTITVEGEGLTKVKIIKGTGSRHRSIWAGVEELSTNEPDVVVVHDGVRPLVPLDVLTQVVNAAADYGAAGAVRPLVSTVIKPDDKGFLQESLYRSHFRNSEMPQAFKYSVLREAYRKCSDDDLDYGTECLALALTYCGVHAKLIPGSPQLWKVTDEKDLTVARIIVPKNTRRIAVVCQVLHSSVTADKSDTSETHCKSVEFEDNGSQSKGDPAKQLMFCDSECLRIYEELRITLGNNSQKVLVSDSVGSLEESTCTLIVISGFKNIESFKHLLQSLVPQMNTHLVTVIMVLTLKCSVQDFTMMDVSTLQHFIRNVSRDIPTRITLVLSKRYDELSSHKCSPSTDDIHVPEGSSSRSDRTCSNIREGPDREESQTETNNPAKKKKSVFDHHEGEGKESQSEKIQDMIMAILDQPTRCFNGQVILLEDEH